MNNVYQHVCTVYSQIAIHLKCTYNLLQQEYRHCNEKLARLLFHFSVIPQTLTQQSVLSTVAITRDRHSVDNTRGETTISLR